MQTGGTPNCAKCGKPAYAAEQTMGPRRQIYHKPCLTCTSCNKRLDSLSLHDHEGLPYCKRCHQMSFGTRDLRSGNVYTGGSPGVGISSPGVGRGMTTPTPGRSGMGSTRQEVETPTKRGGQKDYATMDDLISNEKELPDLMNMTQLGTSQTTQDQDQDRDQEETNDLVPFRVTARSTPRPLPTTPSTANPTVNPIPPSTPNSDSSEPIEPIPAFIPTTTYIKPNYFSPRPIPSSSSSSSSSSSINSTKVQPSGTPNPSSPYRSGVSTPGSTPGSGSGSAGGEKKGVPVYRASPIGGGGNGIGSERDMCEGCGKRVYFAEQVIALSHKWHRGCLRCSTCKSTVDPGKIQDRDGKVYCKNCYGKNFGPVGLLGKR